MQQSLSTNSLYVHRGRIASDAYRRATLMADDFTGLEEGADRYALLLLVKKVGKQAGFTPRMIHLLDYYLAFTRDIDWEEGSRPVVYQSLSRTALDLGVSERQVQNLEKALFEAGAIGWNDSGNHKRYGQRCQETGRLLWAYGVDLTPLAYLREELETKLAEKRLYDDAWMATKRAISACRRQLRAHLAEWSAEEVHRTLEFVARYDEIAVQLRTHLDLAAIRLLLEAHESLLSALLDAMEVEAAEIGDLAQRASTPAKTAKGSSTSEPEFVHYKSTTQSSKATGSRPDSGLQESVAEAPATNDLVACSGLTHVTLAMAVGAASDRLAARLRHTPEWRDVVEAAYQLRPELGVSQASWGEACAVLGRTGAALCLLVTDRATLRSEDPVERPAAYFRGMVHRAERGELRLHRSLFGLLERDRSVA
ncbi:hypothetical protein Pla123a_44690 [Posidoniimonas polymericola]|uniref:Uncharacterized protein n=1 Tax=Posidoniimonas polymericola TaxID=2528002 RepID=A0A5C5XWY3_9BACT|nr:plasmid replication protein RepC [Posidoniimonas polymericola]TWT67039.1 hypothetical protein Pla123a_44690 [Posidoniimonas polymericola]